METCSYLGQAFDERGFWTDVRQGHSFQLIIVRVWGWSSDLGGFEWDPIRMKRLQARRQPQACDPVVSMEKPYVLYQQFVEFLEIGVQWHRTNTPIILWV